MSGETFLLIAALVLIASVVILGLAVLPLVGDVRRTIKAVDGLILESKADVTGLLHDARQISDDAAVLTGVVAKQTKHLDRTIDTTLQVVGESASDVVASTRTEGRKVSRWFAGNWAALKAGVNESARVLRDGNGGVRAPHLE